MKCPKCKSRVEYCLAPDGAVIHYCTSHKCDWQETKTPPPVEVRFTDEKDERD